MNFQLGNAGQEVIYPLTDLAELHPDNQMVNPRPGVAHVPAPPAYQKEYENQLIGCRLDVERGNWPTSHLKWLDLNPEPATFLQLEGMTGTDPVTAALFVRMDNPDELMRAVIRWTVDANISLKNPPAHGSDYLERNVRTMARFSVECNRMMQIAFDAKYYYGMARPEELICPNFGHYGAPWHPEYPAGHGTFAGCVEKVAKEVFDFNPAELEQLERGCRQLAHFRSFAGVHYPYSNDVGYNLGRGEISVQALNTF